MSLTHQIAVGVGIAALGYLIGLAVGILHERSRAARRDALAAAAEREACAKLCDYAATECEYGGDGWYAAKTLAVALRARSEP